ncbi:hypothetical protein, partial [Neokomagataea anthophila]
ICVGHGNNLPVLMKSRSVVRTPFGALCLRAYSLSTNINYDNFPSNASKKRRKPPFYQGFIVFLFEKIVLYLC